MYFWVFSYGECSLQKGYRKGIFFWVANISNIFGVLGIPDFIPRRSRRDIHSVAISEFPNQLSRN